MAVEQEPTTDARGKRASHRLRDMLTTAVGLVDEAANGHRFLVMKSKDGGRMKKADEGAQPEGGLRLPADAKQSLTDGLADALEHLAALGQMVQAAEVDETASCPPELAAQIDGLADDLDELADEFMPEASPAQMRAKGATRKMRKAGKPFPGAAPPFGSKDRDEAAEDAGEVAKGPGPVANFAAAGNGPPIGSPPGAGAGPEVDREPPGEGPGGMTGAPQPRFTAENPAVVMKAGRKMARERLDMLQKGHDAHVAAHELHGQAVAMHKAAIGHLEEGAVQKGIAVCKAANALNEQAYSGHDTGHGHVDRVLKEVGDPGFMQPPGPAPRTQPPSPKPTPAEPEVSPRAAVPDVTGMAKAIAQEAVASALAEPLASLKRTLADLRATQKSMGDAAQLDQLRRSTGIPRSGSSEVSPPEPASRPKMSWPADMSTEVKKQRRANQ